MKAGVLLVGNFPSTSEGNHNVCQDLAARLETAQWLVFTTSGKNGRLSRLLDMLSVAFHNRRRYSVAQVDVYSGLAFCWAEVVCELLQVMRKPYVVTLRGGDLPGFARRWPRRVQRLLRSARIVTTPSRYLQHAMAPYCSELRLLPNPLDLTAYRFVPRDKPQASLIWLRAFHKIYNPSLASDAVARLVREFPTLSLTMIGPDKGDGSFSAARQRAIELGVADRIRFMGGIAKATVPQWLSQADIFLNTTNIDNTPVSVLEAMACGLCTISTNAGGIPSLAR